MPKIHPQNWPIHNYTLRHGFAHKRLKSLRFISLLALGFVAGCASTPTPVDVETRPVVSNDKALNKSAQPDPNDTSQGLGRENTRAISIQRAEYYDRIANQGTNTEQAQSSDPSLLADAALSAAENFIKAGDYQRAQQAVVNLNQALLNQINVNRYRIVQAYVAYARGNHTNALQFLNELIARSSTLPDDVFAPLNIQQIDALLLGSFCYQALGNYEAAIAALGRRENALIGNARAETTRYIWQVINALSIEQRQQLIATTNSTLVRNRLEQSLNGSIGQTRVTKPSEFTQWRDEPTTDQNQIIESQWTNVSAKRIAVLLPLTSRFSQAAQAVRDGIQYQHDNNLSTYRPTLSFYDIGSDVFQAPAFYQAAINSGADLIIGPLGRDYANQIARLSQGTPTILLGGDTPLNNRFARFTLSPEMEGVRVAEKAFNDGYVTAAVLRPESRSAQRSAAAFNQRWLELGGKLNQETLYSSSQFDHSTELRQLFAFSQSEFRHKQISDALGFKPKFAAYQRSDIDFIFLIADNDSGRIVRPQINFFSGSKVPVYATSNIFNGIPNIAQNRDLDQTLFPVMPWVLRSVEVAPYAGQLNKLYALGSDAYLFAANFNALRNTPGYAINGNTGQLAVNANGEILNRPIWAEFVEGQAEALDDLGYDLTPMEPLPIEPDNTLIDNTDRPSQYNDHNRDSRQSRRKVSP